MGNVVLGYVALLNTLFLTAQQSEFKPKVRPTCLLLKAADGSK